VLDMAFHLGGTPTDMTCYHLDNQGKYTSTTSFAGAGISKTGALFAYQTNWLSPGRWAVEIQTARHRLVFRPMETLQVQELGSFTAQEYPLDDSLDKAYKPGIYLQVKTFVENPDDERFLSIAEQSEHMRIYRCIHDGKPFHS
jgi:hypothetical protein